MGGVLWHWPIYACSSNGAIGLDQVNALYLGLALLISGNGMFKPNISTKFGDLYQEGDNRRDGAFTIFYMGINLGALLGGLISGAAVDSFGWKLASSRWYPVWLLA